MFIFDDIVVIDLPKTASSHVRKLMARVSDGHSVGVHVPAGPRLRKGKAHFWGTIRNPWDWYVSLWAYGCDGKGTLYHALTSSKGWLSSRGWKHAPIRAARSLLEGPGRHRKQWQEAYSDVNSPDCFRSWLGMVHDPACAKDLGDTYAQSRMAGFAGFLTWRYLKLYCAGSARGLGSLQELESFDREHCYITRFIRTEQLETDLKAAFAHSGKPLTVEQEKLLEQGGRSNPSSRKRDTGWYYDSETIELVARRDGLLVNKFGFLPPRDPG